MKTTSEAVEKVIKQSPFLEEFMSDGIINLTALSRKIKKEVENILKKEVKHGAIIMALNRYTPSLTLNAQKKLLKFMSNLGAITVRSNLSDHTFLNSKTLVLHQKDLLGALADKKDVFYAVTIGINETTFVISASESNLINKLFKTEEMLSSTENLASVSIKLPTALYDTPGVYYHILKKIAWAGINVIEVISTTYEFTVVMDEKEVVATFNILNELKKGN